MSRRVEHRTAREVAPGVTEYPDDALAILARREASLDAMRRGARAKSVRWSLVVGARGVSLAVTWYHQTPAGLVVSRAIRVAL